MLMFWISIKLLPIYFAAFITPLFFMTWSVRKHPEHFGIFLVCLFVVLYSIRKGLVAYKEERTSSFVARSVVPPLIGILGVVVTSFLPI